MNDDELARLARATWNQEPPDNLERILEEAARRLRVELPAAIGASYGHVASHPAPRPQPADHVASHPAPRPQPADADFIVFYRNVVPRLVAFLTLRGAELADAADIAQDAMLAAYRHWDTLERPEAWAFRVALRGIKQLQRPAMRAEQPAPAKPSNEEAYDPVATWEQTDEIRLLLATLSPRQREVLVLFFVADLSTAEIAEVLNITSGTVKAHLHRGRQALRRLLEATTGK